MMNQENENIYEWDTKKLWNALLTLPEEIKAEYKGELYLIKWGYKTCVPIHYYIKEEWYTVDPKKAQVYMAYGKTIKIIEFYDELERRETEMRRIIEQVNMRPETVSPDIELE